MSTGANSQLIQQIAREPHRACRALATVGPELVGQAVRDGRFDELTALLEIAVRDDHLFFQDTLELLYEGLVSVEEFFLAVLGADETVHHPDFVRLALETQGKDAALAAMSGYLGMDLDAGELEALGTPQRVLELFQAPLLKRGLSEHEARGVFGDAYTQVEQVEPDAVHRTWTYRTQPTADIGEVICELKFQDGVLVGWTDRREVVDVELGRRRLKRQGNIPPQVGGFELAAVAVTMVALEMEGVDSETIASVRDQEMQSIQSRQSNWPFSELESLAPLVEIQRTQRVTLDEGRDRLDHCHARFSGYNPDHLVVPTDQFIDCALAILDAAGGIVTPVPLRRGILLGILASLFALTAGLMAIRCESEHQTKLHERSGSPESAEDPSAAAP